MADGRRLGFVGPRFHDPYDVEVASGGAVYVLDTAAAGRLYRVASDGKTTVVARR
jgi:glucose/arabinose dehydrogenase